MRISSFLNFPGGEMRFLLIFFFSMPTILFLGGCGDSDSAASIKDMYVPACSHCERLVTSKSLTYPSQDVYCCEPTQQPEVNPDTSLDRTCTPGFDPAISYVNTICSPPNRSPIEAPDDCWRLQTELDWYNPWVCLELTNDETEFTFSVGTQFNKCFPVLDIESPFPPENHELNLYGTDVFVEIKISNEDETSITCCPQGSPCR